MFGPISSLPIRVKLSVGFFLILLIISVFIYTYYPNKQKLESMQTLENKVQSMADMVALGVGIALGSDDFTAVGEVLEWAKREPDLRYIVLVDTSGESFGSYNPYHKKVDIAAYLAKGGVFEAGEDLNAHAQIKYRGKTYGNLLLGFSLRTVNLRIEESKIATLYISLAILVAGVLLAMITSSFVTKPLKDLREAAHQVSQGNNNIQIKISTKDELGVLGQAFNDMVRSIRKSIEEIENQNWQKHGLAELSQLIHGEPAIGHLAESIICFLANYMDAQIGALFLVGGDENRLTLAAGYALPKREQQKTCFEFGEGLVGQAAKSRKQILLNGVPDDSPILTSGILHSASRNVLIIPFLYGGKVKGVIELASFKVFTEVKLNFLSQSLESIAIVFNSAESRKRVNNLLESTQKQAQELTARQVELKKANKKLETQQRLLKKKNSELKSAQHEIEQKAIQLEQTSKYKSEFLANMSHEIRMPLNAIIGMTELCLETEMTYEQRDFLQVVQTSSDGLLSVINDILDFSKIEAGQLQLEETDFNFALIVERVAEILSIRAEKKQLELTCYVDQGLPKWVIGDPTRLQQILANLLGNAIKFTNKGDVSIQVKPLRNSQRQEGNDAIGLHFMVSDTGVGISQNNLERIFDKFSQEDASTTRKFGGTGLGLSISKSLIELMGGKIWAESEPGKGSTFHVMTIGIITSLPNRFSLSKDIRSTLQLTVNWPLRHTNAATTT